MDGRPGRRVGTALNRRGTTSFWSGFWRLADPRISLASLASIVVGAAAAAAAGPLDIAWLLVTVVGIFGVELGKNASGEVFDYDSGADLAVAPEDRSPFSGGKRVLVEGLLTRGQTWVIATLGYGAAVLCGLLVVVLREPAVLWLGLGGLALAYFYHAPPVALSYRGLGEAAVGLCYGPGVATGTFLVQRGEMAAVPVLVSLPLGLLVAAFLWVNEFPDYRADRSAGKRNLVVRIGRRRAGRVFAVGIGLAFGSLVALPALGLPAEVLLGLAGLPPAVFAARLVLRHPEETARLVPAQACTLLSFLLYAVGAGAGLLL